MGRFQNLNDVCSAMLRNVAVFLCNRFYAGILITLLFVIVTVIGLLNLKSSPLGMVFQFLPDGTMLVGPLGSILTLAAFQDIPDIVGMVFPMLPMVFPLIPWRTVARFAAPPLAAALTAMLAAPAASSVSAMVPGAGVAALYQAAVGAPPTPSAFGIADIAAFGSKGAIAPYSAGASAARGFLTTAGGNGPLWMHPSLNVGDAIAARTASAAAAARADGMTAELTDDLAGPLSGVLGGLRTGSPRADAAVDALTKKVHAHMRTAQATSAFTPTVAAGASGSDTDMITDMLNMIMNIPILADNNFNDLWEFLNGDTWIDPLITLLDLPPGTDVFGMIGAMIPVADEVAQNTVATNTMRGTPRNMATVSGLRYLANWLDSMEDFSAKCVGSQEPFRPGHWVRDVPEQEVCGFAPDGTPLYTNWRPLKHTSILSLLGIWKRGTNSWRDTRLRLGLPLTPVNGVSYCHEEENLSWDTSMPTSDEDVLTLIHRLQRGEVAARGDQVGLESWERDPSSIDRPLFVGPKAGGELDGNDVTRRHPEGTFFDTGYYIGSPKGDESGLLTSIGAYQFKVYVTNALAGNCLSAATKLDKGKKPVIYPGFPDITNVDALMTDVAALYWCVLPIVVTIIVVTCRTTHHLFWARTRMALNCWIAVIILLAIGGGFSMVGHFGMESTSINLIGAFVVVGASLDGFFVLNSHYIDECKHITHRVHALAKIRTSGVSTDAAEAGTAAATEAAAAEAANAPSLSTDAAVGVAAAPTGQQPIASAATSSGSTFVRPGTLGFDTGTLSLDDAFDEAGDAAFDSGITLTGGITVGAGSPSAVSAASAASVPALDLAPASPMAAVAPMDLTRAKSDLAVLELGISDVHKFYCGEPPHTRVPRAEELVRVRIAELASIEAFAEAGTTILIALTTTSASMFFMCMSAMPALRSMAVQSGFSTVFVFFYFILLYYPAWVADNRRMARGCADFSNAYYSAADLEEVFRIEGPKLEAMYSEDPETRKQGFVERMLAALMRGVTTTIGSVVVSIITVILIGFGIWGWAGGVEVKTDESLIDYKEMPGQIFGDILTKHFARHVTVEFMMSEVDLLDPVKRDAVRATLDRVRRDIPLYNPGGVWKPEEHSILCFLEEGTLGNEGDGSYLSPEDFLRTVGDMACEAPHLPKMSDEIWLSHFQPLSWFGSGDSTLTDSVKYATQWASADNFADRVFPLAFTSLVQWVLTMVVSLVAGLLPPDLLAGMTAGPATGAVFQGTLQPLAASAAVDAAFELGDYSATQLLYGIVGHAAPSYFAAIDADPALAGLSTDELSDIYATAAPGSAAAPGFSHELAHLTPAQSVIFDRIFTRAFQGKSPATVVAELAALHNDLVPIEPALAASAADTAVANAAAAATLSPSASVASGALAPPAVAAFATGPKGDDYWKAAGVPPASEPDPLEISQSYQRNLAAIVRYFKLGTCDMISWEREHLDAITPDGAPEAHYHVMMYPMLSTCRVFMEKEVPRSIYSSLNATVAPDLYERGRFGAFFSSYDFLLMLIDANVPSECISTAVCIVLLCAVFGVLFLSHWKAGVILTVAILFIQLSLLSGWAIFGYGLNMITLAAFILSAGMSIDYAFHVTSSYLSAPYQPDKRKRIIEGVSATGSAVFVGWFTSVVTMVPLAFTRLNTFVSFFYCFFLVLAVSLFFAFCVIPMMLWWAAPNVQPRAEVNLDLLKRRQKARRARKKRDRERARRAKRGLAPDPESCTEQSMTDDEGTVIVRRRRRVRTGGSSVGSVCPTGEGYSEFTSDGAGNRVRRRRARQMPEKRFEDSLSNLDREILHAAAGARRQAAQEEAKEKRRLRVMLRRATRAMAMRIDAVDADDVGTTPAADFF